MNRKPKIRDYELDILEAKFEIAKLKWAEAGESIEFRKKLEKECIT